jgi:hypothetical protein
VRGRMRRVVREFGVAVVDASVSLPASSERAGANGLSAALVLVTFAAGRRPSRMGLSVLWGALVLSVGLAAYYAWLLLVHDVAWGRSPTNTAPAHG